jgi:hypothetical protein
MLRDEDQERQVPLCSQPRARRRRRHRRALGGVRERVRQPWVQQHVLRCDPTEPEPEVAGGDNEAPSPWRQIKTNDGRFYYWNTATNDTTLDEPADGFSLYAQQYYWPEPEPQPEPEPEPDDEVWDLDERGMAGMYTPDSRWMEFLPDEEWERDRPACFNESPMYFDGEQW